MRRTYLDHLVLLDDLQREIFVDRLVLRLDDIQRDLDRVERVARCEEIRHRFLPVTLRHRHSTSGEDLVEKWLPDAKSNSVNIARWRL